MSRGLPIGRFLGSEIRVHLSWVLLLGFLTASLGAAGLPDRYPTWSVVLTWIVAAASALGLFLGVLVHEGAHLAVARRCGVPAGPVTILLFGAPATLEGGARTARAEAAIGLAGPVASLLIAGITIGGAMVLGGPVASGASGRGATAAIAAAEVLLSAGILNGLVGLLNLVPVFPLDGARILRAVAWRVANDPRRGSRAAVRSGQLVGIAVAAGGIAIVIWGDAIDGMVVIFLGWFVRNASVALGRREDLEGAVAGLVVDEVMDRDLPTIPPQVTLDTFAEVLLGPGEMTVLPVIGGDELLGLVGHSALRRAGKKAWSTTHARDIMSRLEELPVVTPRDALRPAIQLLQVSGADGIPVFDNGSFAGVLTRHGVGRALRQRVPDGGFGRRRQHG